MADGEFRRRLTVESLDVLRTNPVASRIVDAAREDDALDLHLRGSYIDVYYDSLPAFQLDLEGGRVRLGSSTDRRPRPAPWPGVWAPLDVLEPADIEAGMDWIRLQTIERPTAIERELESNIVRDNRSPDSPVMVLDRQVTEPGWNLRADLLLYDVEAERMALAGLGLVTDVDRSGDVFEELLRYQALFCHTPGVAAAYPHVYEQKVALRLTGHDLSRLRVDRKPLLLYVLGGYDQATAATWAREKMRVGVQRKRREFRTLRIRVHSIRAFREEGACRLPALERLPLLEDWAAADELI